MAKLQGVLVKLKRPLDETPRSVQVIVAAAVLVGAAWFAYEIGQNHLAPSFDDFRHYRAAGIRAWNHQTSYGLKSFYTFNYPPFCAFAYRFLLLAWLPEPIGSWMFHALSELLWLAAFAATAMVFTPKGWWARHAWPARAILAVFCCSFASQAIRDDLWLGQTTVIALLAAICGIAFWQAAEEATDRRRFLLEMAAALALSFAVQIKVYWAILGLVALARARWRFALAWVLLSTVALNGLLLIAFHGLDFTLGEWGRWFHEISRVSDRLELNQYDVSLMALFRRHGYGSSAGHAATALGAVGLTSMVIRYRRAPLILLCAYTIACAPLLSAICWPYWIVVCLPLVACVGARLEKRSRLAAVLPIAGLSLLWAAQAMQNTPWLDAGYLTLCWLAGAVVLGAELAGSVRPVRREAALRQVAAAGT